MKKLLITFCVLLAFVISIGVEALTDDQVSNRIYAILSTVLSDPATHTELFSDNAYQSVVSQIEAEGFTLSHNKALETHRKASAPAIVGAVF